MALFQQLNRLGILSAGRRPEWKSDDDTDGAPRGTDGVALNGAMKTLIHVPVRQSAHGRTAYLDVEQDDEQPDNNYEETTYTIEVEDYSVEVDGQERRQETLETIVDEIGGDENLSELVDAEVYERDGEKVVRLVGRNQENYDLAVDAEGGDGAISAEIDPAGALARIWLRAGGINNANRPDAWAVAHSAEFDLDQRGMTERLTTSGYSRVYVEIIPEEPVGKNVHGRTISAYIGPGVME